MRKKPLCFDLDETLIKSHEAHFLAFNLAFKKNGLKTVTRNKLIPLLNGQHAEQIIKKLFPNLLYTKIKRVREDHHNFIAKKTWRYARAIKGTKQALRKLQKHYKLAIVTNCTHCEINALLKGAGISKKFFAAIIGKEDVKRSKPFPDEIFKVEKLLHLQAAYHIGDSIYDIIAAKKAHVKAIAVLTGVASRKELQKENPDLIIQSITKLPKILISKKD